jgi:hypothetical protein
LFTSLALTDDGAIAKDLRLWHAGRWCGIFASIRTSDPTISCRNFVDPGKLPRELRQFLLSVPQKLRNKD